MIIPKMAIEDLIASEGIADTATVGLQTAGKVVNAVGALGKGALTVKGTIGRSSVTRMGRDSILEFPAIFSAGIDTDDSIAIAKMLEKYYASLLVSIFSLRPSIALNEYSDIAEYIKSIHSNNPIPSNLRKARHFAKESLEDTTAVQNDGVTESLNSDEYCLVDDEASGLTVNGVTSECTDPDLAYECWGIQGGALNMDSINEIVTPYRRSQALLQERIDMAKGTEAVSNNIADVANSVASKAGRVISVGRNSNPTITLDTDLSAKKVGTGATMANGNGKIDMAPTMIDVTFYLHGSKKGGSENSASFTQQVKLGVKAMARVVSSDYVITNLVEGSKSSNPIFKFISWTRGELKLVKDLIFNVSEVKKKFKDKRKDEYGLLQMSKDRKEVDDVAKFAGNRILPYVSLIVTDYEVAQTAQVTGVDLTNYRNAKAFMERYYLLAFGIYNQNTKTLSILYDGASDFEDMSMAYIQTEQKKSMDVTKNFANMVSMR